MSIMLLEFTRTESVTRQTNDLANDIKWSLPNRSRFS